MQRSPFLDVSLDESIWKKVDGEKMGKPGVFWWALNADHDYFSSNYKGVIHGEVISYHNQDKVDDVMNLAVDTGAGHGVYSFGFSRHNGELTIFLNSNKNPLEDKKVFKIMIELLFHLPDFALKKSLSEKLVQQLFKKSESTTIWEKV
ncbi:hypothetical protein HUU53_00520 [Candidatus Micrarchaeota archaeon]|nr:hypothetical protein [Candidatus Micrarchaeota archaeon]